MASLFLVDVTASAAVPFGARQVSGIDAPPECAAAIRRRYRVIELAVFGSAARGDELSVRFGSHVDLSWKSLLKPLVRRDALRDAVVHYTA